MSLLGWFRRRREHAKPWRRVADRLGARYRPATPSLPSAAVQLDCGSSRITLDLELLGEGGVSTRMRAPYVSPDGLHFRVHRAGFLSKLGKHLGIQDIDTGHKAFDDYHIIRSNSSVRMRQLFANERLRNLILRQRAFRIEVRSAGGLPDQASDRVRELRFHESRIITDEDRLLTLFAIFQEMLPELSRDERPDDDEVERNIRRLKGPGGRIVEGGFLLWDGDPERRAAARRLGELRDSRAIGTLLSMMDDPDRVLVARAIEALGRIGDPRAIPPLVPLLGEYDLLQGKSRRYHAAAALVALGQGPLADAVISALGGDASKLDQTAGQYRLQVFRALFTALRGADVAHAARAFCELGAVEALPRMRAAARSLDSRSPVGQAVRAAIQDLEARAALPRPADQPSDDGSGLPRVAEQPGPDDGTLPRVTEGDEERS